MFQYIVKFSDKVCQKKGHCSNTKISLHRLNQILKFGAGGAKICIFFLIFFNCFYFIFIFYFFLIFSFFSILFYFFLIFPNVFYFFLIFSIFLIFGIFCFFFMYTFVFVICSATLEGLPLLMCQDVLLGAITRRVEFASESTTVEKSLGPVHNCSQFVSTNWGNCNCNKIGPCQQSLISEQPSTPDVIKC